MTELVQKAFKSTLVKHLVEAESLREEPRSFGAQEQPLDGDISLGNVAGHDQKTQPVNPALKSAVGLLARNHEFTVAQPDGGCEWTPPANMTSRCDIPQELFSC